MNQSNSTPQGVGVDIISKTRIKDFMNRHRSRLTKILTEKEEHEMNASSDPVRFLAYLFSAKESVFKSLNLAWFGIDGFRLIEVDMVDIEAQQATASLSGVIQEQVQDRISASKVLFSEKDDFVIARAASYK